MSTNNNNNPDEVLDPSELVQPIFKHGLYDNPWDTWSEIGLAGVLKWMWSRGSLTGKQTLSKEQLDERIPIVPTEWDKIKNPPQDNIQTTWIGHASSLVQLDGVNFLTDPVFSERCSPLKFAGPKRYRDTPFKKEDLPTIDFVVISHDHYDHLDYDTVQHLGNKPTWFVPKGLKKWFNDNNITNVVELSWWEEHQFNDTITVACTPCQHWSKRNAFDKRKALWSSWVVMGKNGRVFFSGDTGYCPVFKTIGKKYGPFDLGLIAIGAYCPREFMKPQHIDPPEAVQIHQDIRSKFSVGIHWGTFFLTDEPEDEPPVYLQKELTARGLPLSEFITLNIGQTKSVR